MLPWLGGLIVLATIYGIVKRWETRLVLFTAGLAMALIALKPMEAFAAFTKSMTNPGLISAILSVMGFAYVMKLTKCDQHLVHLVAGAVSKIRFALIPAATLATFFINIALPSAAGAAAAVGAVLIPVLMAAGVHPAVAAAAILAGTFGSVMSPGSSHINMVAKMTEATPVETIGVISTTAILAGVIGALALTAFAYFRKEASGHTFDVQGSDSTLKVNYLMAMVPLVPLVLLILGSRESFASWGMTVPAAMLIGTLIAVAISRTNPVAVTKSFFDGMGTAYGDIMGIIIAAGVFTAGLTQVGLIQVLLDNLTGAKSAIGMAGTWGPMLIAILSGSGDAATIAFNEAVTPHAGQFGLGMAQLGTLASLAGALGRSMSPVAGACIVVAGIAKVNPVEVAKRNAPGMIIASIVAFLLMGI